MFKPTLSQMLLMFTLILIGFLLRKKNILPDNAHIIMSKLETWVFVPALNFSNMVKNFTVEKDNTDYTLGDYMLMKAKAKRNAMTVAAGTSLAVANSSSTSLTTVFSYIGEKLKVKKAPERDKTMRKFPFRASFTALCSATVVCALVVCCTIFGLSSANTGRDNVVSIVESDAEINAIETEDTVFTTLNQNI